MSRIACWLIDASERQHTIINHSTRHSSPSVIGPDVLVNNSDCVSGRKPRYYSPTVPNHASVTASSLPANALREIITTIIITTAATRGTPSPARNE